MTTAAVLWLGGWAALLGVRRVRRLRSHAANTPEAHGLQAEAVAIVSTAKQPLHAWWLAHPVGPAPAVLLVHGYLSHSGDLLPVAALLADAGFHVLAVDLRGHGRSSQAGYGPPPVLADDAQAALAWLAARDDVTRVGMLGHSMGGTVAIIAASRSAHVDAVVTVAAVADPTMTRTGWWPGWVSRLFLASYRRRTGTDPRLAFARERIRSVDVPVLLLHGTADRIVPSVHAQVLADARPDAQLLLVEGANHTSLDAFRPAMGRVVDFLQAALAPTDRPRH